jgi:5-oxoprolinase (ATP-hydrolysing)
MLILGRGFLDTPGGGGYGVPGTMDDRMDEEVYKRSVVLPVRGAGSLASWRAAAHSAS